MASRADEKQRARAAREAAEERDRRAAARRRSLTRLGIVVAAAAVIVVAAVLISQGGGEDEPALAPVAQESSEVAALFEGIPQDGITLGDPDAPATLTEFVDLQCPFCAEYTTGALPTVIERYVRTGRLKIELQVLQFLGPDSEKAAAVAGGAAEQDKLWQFTDVFFRNQGEENSGYVTDEFLRSIAERTPGLDVDAALAGGNDQMLSDAQAAADDLGADSTPSFFLAQGDGEPEPLEVSELTPEAMTQALDAALAQQ
jgi:protein-disulfide isomerase